LKHVCIAIATCATLDQLLRNIWNKLMKHMKQLKHKLETCVYCHCNICNIPDWLLQHSDKNTWNISLKYLKHLKHESETPETLETRRRWRPWPTWWGTAVATKLWRMRTANATARADTCPRTTTGTWSRRRRPLPGTRRRGMGAEQQWLDDKMERHRIRMKDW
jgi:hypothetical protein